MKPTIYLLIACAAFSSMSCNKQKKAIDEVKNAQKEEVDLRKEQVNAAADKA